jgi:hypothetical protein
MLERATASSSFQYLDNRARQLLGSLLRIDVPSLRVYTGRQADAAVSEAGADAVAYRGNLFFRTGMYEPAAPSGMGLMAHEVTHLVQQPLPGPASTVADLDDANEDREERQALDVERQVQNYLARETKEAPAAMSPAIPPPGRSVPPLADRPGPSAEEQVPAVRAASRSRDVSARVIEPPQGEAPTISPEQLRRIKEELYNDILDRIRTDFERGA